MDFSVRISVANIFGLAISFESGFGLLIGCFVFEFRKN